MDEKESGFSPCKGASRSMLVQGKFSAVHGFSAGKTKKKPRGESPDFA
jgi:hypothetical protein